MSVNVKQSGGLVKVAGLYEATAPMGIADCYSTEERLVGCWTSGKPLYQKTLYATNVALSANGRTVVFSTSDLSSLSIDEIVGEVDGLADFNSGANIISIPYAIANTSDSIGAYYDNGYGICIHRLGNALTLGNLYLTIQYTKTTDTAGSGTWTPNGDLAVHYSTNEQVIGTWIDGSTLYRKVTKITTTFNLTADTWVSTGISASSIQRIIRTQLINQSPANVIVSGAIQNDMWSLNSPRTIEVTGATTDWYLILEYTKASS